MSADRKCLLVRTDASESIGTGHVMRCLALAQAWQRPGSRVQFALGMTANGLETRLAAEGVAIAQISAPPGSEEDAAQTSDLARSANAGWVVLDGYHFGANYQRAIKKAGLMSLCVDDYGHADHYWADVVLNQNSYADEATYCRREPYTRLLLGSTYALLRREFSRWRGWRRAISPVGGRILVTFGGSDPNNVTLAVIKALGLLNSTGFHVRVVVGAANPNRELLAEEAGRGHCRVELVNAATDMPDLMAWADLAISAAGSTCWELAFMGVPMVTIIQAENQRFIAENLAQSGVALNAGWHHAFRGPVLAEIVSRLVGAPEMRRRMSGLGQAMVDGFGAQRVAETLGDFEFQPRSA